MNLYEEKSGMRLSAAQNKIGNMSCGILWLIEINVYLAKFWRRKVEVRLKSVQL